MIAILHTINKGVLIINLVLYLTLIGGLYAQPFLGIIQLAIACTVTYKYYRLADSGHKGLLNRYWFSVLAVAIYITTVFTCGGNGNPVLIISSLFVIPMAIACYFVYVTAQFKEQYKNI